MSFASLFQHFNHTNPANPVCALLQAFSACEIIHSAQLNIHSRYDTYNRARKLIDESSLPPTKTAKVRTQNQRNLHTTVVYENTNLLCTSLIIIQRIAFVTMQYVPNWPVTIALHIGIFLTAALLEFTRKNTLRAPDTSPTRVNSVCNVIFDYITPLQNTIILLSFGVLAIYQDMVYIIGMVSMGIIQYITPKRFSSYLRVASKLITILVNPILFLRLSAAYALYNGFVK